MENNDKRNEKPGRRSPKRSFNFYWIYGIIILVILSINLFQYGGGMVKIDPTEYQKMLETGDVQRIVVVNDQMVKVFIKKEKLAKEPHKDKIKGSPISGRERDRTALRLQHGQLRCGARTASCKDAERTRCPTSTRPRTTGAARS